MNKHAYFGKHIHLLAIAALWILRLQAPSRVGTCSFVRRGSVSHGIDIIRMIVCAIVFLSSMTDGAPAHEYTCADSRWSLKTKNPESRYRQQMNIFTISNVLVTPAPRGMHAVNVVVSAEDAITANNALHSCHGSHKTETEKEPAVFFNCPCVEFRGCPGFLAFATASASSWAHATSKNSKDLLLVYNSWGSSSRYHAIIDTLFPVWATVRRVKTHFKKPVDSLTLLNLSPGCAADPHLEVMKPLVDVMFGEGVYEDVSGEVSRSFRYSSPARYNMLIHGFLYAWTPFKDKKYDFTPELGVIFRQFAAELKEKLSNKSSKSSSPSPSAVVPSTNVSQLRVVMIVRSGRGDKRGFTSLSGLISAFKSSVHPATTQTLMSACPSSTSSSTIVATTTTATTTTTTTLHKPPPVCSLDVEPLVFGEGSLRSWSEQAAAASNINVLMGVEGAGFVQQLLMPLGSLIVILHSKDISTSRWHEAVAVYLDHSVLNIRLGSLALDDVVLHRIAHVTRVMTALHARLVAEGKFAICDVWDLGGGVNGSSSSSSSIASSLSPLPNLTVPPGGSSSTSTWTDKDLDDACKDARVLSSVGGVSGRREREVSAAAFHAEVKRWRQ